ncbi:hypothetical protein HNQ93_001266 [Hymenobacter luteus]|uniref:Uncharacterized protein n=2 Tax=Hymenobacter TaxID=89966 RepID=A0A7W9SYX1_9BACT|nr:MULTISPECIES: hypothetical protein [Hymenobacter]MBB4601373.1 hypothetical protein [Hymenobacter latericoloratus]MBB6058420.1 hypothetical protein [Hymenobacter luteus]
MPKSRSRKGRKVEPVAKKRKEEKNPDSFHRIGNAYYKLMKEAGERIDALRPMITDLTLRENYLLNFEAIALSYRKIAEVIVFANLAGHEREYADLYPKYQQEWRIKEIIQRIKGINPGYYPRPRRRNPTKDINQIEHLQLLSDGEWMTEDELIDMYNTCSGLIHAQNSFKEDIDLTPFPALFQSWANKLVGLLNYHLVHLPDGKHSVSFQMRDSNTGLPSVFLFEDITDQMPESVLSELQGNQSAS